MEKEKRLQPVIENLIISQDQPFGTNLNPAIFRKDGGVVCHTGLSKK